VLVFVLLCQRKETSSKRDHHHEWDMAGIIRLTRDHEDNTKRKGRRGGCLESGDIPFNGKI
jgi:hypothetical protein